MFVYKSISLFYTEKISVNESLSNRVSKPPQTLDELGISLELWESLNGGLSATEAKFPPLHDQFGILEKYEVTIPDDVSDLL